MEGGKAEVCTSMSRQLGTQNRSPHLSSAATCVASGELARACCTWTPRRSSPLSMSPNRMPLLSRVQTFATKVVTN